MHREELSRHADLKGKQSRCILYSCCKSPTAASQNRVSDGHWFKPSRRSSPERVTPDGMKIEYSCVAQLAEHPTVNRTVAGSSPAAGAHLMPPACCRWLFCSRLIEVAASGNIHMRKLSPGHFTIQKPYIILRNLSPLQIRHSGLIPEHRDTNTFFDIELGKRPTNRLFDCLQLHSETLSNFSVSHSFADQC